MGIAAFVLFGNLICLIPWSVFFLRSNPFRSFAWRVKLPLYGLCCFWAGFCYGNPSLKRYFSLSLAEPLSLVFSSFWILRLLRPWPSSSSLDQKIPASTASAMFFSADLRLSKRLSFAYFIIYYIFIIWMSYKCLSANRYLFWTKQKQI